MAASKCIDNLPDELIVEIFSYLHGEELAITVQAVCKRWKEIAQDIRLWKEFTFVPPVDGDERRVRLLLSRMPQLRSFTLTQVYGNKDVLAPLSLYCLNITSITCNMEARDLHNVHFFHNFPNLEYLYVHPTILFHLLENGIPGAMCKLQRVKCTASIESDSPYMSSRQHSKLSDSFKSLQQLEFNVCKQVQLMEKLIDINAASLVHLCVSGVYDLMLPIILGCQKLRVLKLNFLSRLCDNFKSFLADICKLKELKVLSLQLFVDPSQDVLCTLFSDKNLLGLTELDLRNCMNFSQRVAAGISRSCPGLQVLQLQACSGLDDACLEQLAKCRELQVLNVSGCTRLTELGLARIARCRQLHTLNLSWVGAISGLMLESLTGAISLRKLFLDYNSVTQADLIIAVQKMPSLVYLSVYGCADLNPSVLQTTLKSVRILSKRPPIAVW